MTRFPIDWTAKADGAALSASADDQIDANFDDELIKAAAQLDSNYPDIVIDEDDGMEWTEDLNNELNEEEYSDEDDEQMGSDQNQEIDLEDFE